MATAGAEFTKVFTYNGSAFTDVTLETQSPSGTAFTMLGSTNHFLYLGHDSKFDMAIFDLATVGSLGLVKWEFYNGSAWKQLIDIDTWVSDGSGNYTVTGGLDTSGGTFVATTNAGAPSASSANGAIAIDTTNNKLYFRSGSAWRLASEESDTAADGGDSGSYVRLFICADGGGAS